MTSEMWRIVLVDDSPDDRAEARRMLLKGSDRRYAFSEAETGVSGMRAVREAAAAEHRCVVLDFNLPDMTAPEFLAAISGPDGLPRWPVVVLTGDDNARTGRTALRGGAHDYIGKGWMTPQGLTRAIEIAVERWEMQRELRRHRQELQTLSDNSPDFLTRFDRELRHVFVSAAVERATGRVRQDFLGRTNRELGMDEALCAQWEAALRQVFDTGRPKALEFSFDLAGSLRHYAADLVPEFNADAQVEYVLGVARDVTERRAAELLARESAERLQMALAAAQAGAWGWEIASGRIDWSPENYALYGFDPARGAPVYGDWEGRVHPDDREAANAAVRDALDGRAAEFRAEFRVVHPEKGARWLLGLGKVEFDGDGVPRRMVGINLDITERKQLERALQEQDRRKDDFLATLAHELRNPLAPLRTGLEVIRRAPAGAPVAVEVLAMMERQLGQMVRLVDDLLEVSRINSGKIELQRAPVELQQVVERAIEASRPDIDKAGHTLEVRLPAAPLWVDGDLVRLCQVVGNLLNNAAKYTPNGGHIEVDVAVVGEQARLRVADDGIGISPDMLPLIFGMYAQVTEAVGRAQGGLGIGLALVRKLVDLHGGSVAVDSPGPGKGSAFTLWFPLLSVADPASIEAAGAAVASDPPTQLATVAVREFRILVVDDNVDGAESLALLLGLLGHETRIAGNGKETLTAVPAFAPDIVFLDIGLPGMSGYEVARELRRLPACRDTALIALTGWGGEEDRKEAMAAGFDHHLTKPVDPTRMEEVLALCAALTGRRKAAYHRPSRPSSIDAGG